MMHRFGRSRAGSSTLESALLAAVLGVGLIGVLGHLSGALTSTYDSLVTGITVLRPERLPGPMPPLIARPVPGHAQ